MTTNSLQAYWDWYLKRKWLKRYPADIHMADQLSDCERTGVRAELCQMYQQALCEEETATKTSPADAGAPIAEKASSRTAEWGLTSCV